MHSQETSLLRELLVRVFLLPNSPLADISVFVPAGVGIGKNPPVYLKPGDKIEIAITGLGTLTNTVSSDNSARPACSPVRSKPPQSKYAKYILSRIEHLFITHPESTPSHSLELFRRAFTMPYVILGHHRPSCSFMVSAPRRWSICPSLRLRVSTRLIKSSYLTSKVTASVL